MRKLTLLDCTLRDGGYYTNWNFSSDLVEIYLQTVSKLPISYIELGYLSDVRDNNGPFYHLNYNSISFAKKILRKDIGRGIKLLELLVNTSIMSSKSEARRAINNKGIKINDLLVVDENKILDISDFVKENMKISFGKKKHFLFKIT